MIRLGVNIDHVATVRNARGERYPDPLKAATLAELGGADNITCHLREDRRHIVDEDVYALRKHCSIPLNLEMAVTEEMVGIACDVSPHSVTLVPEKREELTTEGGLNLEVNQSELKKAISRLKEKRITVALFVDPSLKMIEISSELGADAVEIHTGDLCANLDNTRKTIEALSLVREVGAVAAEAKKLGLQVHFGHGLHYNNAGWLQAIPECEEANIGHSIVSRSIFVGLIEAVREMKQLLNDPSHNPLGSSINGR